MKLISKIIVFLFAIGFVSSCTQQPKCNDKQIKELVVAALKNHISESVEKTFNEEIDVNSPYYSYIEKILDEKTIFIDELELKVYETKTNSIEKEIKKCDCEGLVSAIEKSNVLDNIESDNFRKTKSQKYMIVGIKPIIKYSAQLTDENKLYVNILNIEDLEVYEKNILLKLMYKLKQKIKDLD